jgi:hypothetical protein
MGNPFALQFGRSALQGSTVVTPDCHNGILYFSPAYSPGRANLFQDHVSAGYAQDADESTIMQPGEPKPDGVFIDPASGVRMSIVDLNLTEGNNQFICQNGAIYLRNVPRNIARITNYQSRHG